MSRLLSLSVSMVMSTVCGKREVCCMLLLSIWWKRRVVILAVRTIFSASLIIGIARFAIGVACSSSLRPTRATTAAMTTVGEITIRIKIVRQHKTDPVVHCGRGLFVRRPLFSTFSLCRRFHHSSSDGYVEGYGLGLGMVYQFVKSFFYSSRNERCVLHGSTANQRTRFSRSFCTYHDTISDLNTTFELSGDTRLRIYDMRPNGSNASEKSPACCCTETPSSMGG